MNPIRCTFPAEPEAVPAARDALAPLEDELGDLTRMDLRLLVSELVTNAVRHGGRTAGASVELVAERRPGEIRVEVYDDGPGILPEDVTGPAADRASGWGLQLVEKVARTWGTATDPRAHVWFELALG